MYIIGSIKKYTINTHKMAEFRHTWARILWYIFSIFLSYLIELTIHSHICILKTRILYSKPINARAFSFWQVRARFISPSVPNEKALQLTQYMCICERWL